jgi:chromate transporter
MLIGWLRGGPPGAFAAWIGFTLPSALLMTVIALELPHASIGTAWLHPVLIVAAAVVASALVAMRASLAPDFARLAIAFALMAVVLAFPLPYTVPLAIAGAALAGLAVLRSQTAVTEPTLDLRVRPHVATIVIAAFAFAFFVLGWWASTGAHAAILFDVLFRVGSLVFGGGHVVLPLLQTQAVAAGIVDQRAVLTGYAAAQAMPGPLFTISSFVGAAAWNGGLGALGAALGTVAIFAPSFFLLAGIAPFYRALASSSRFRSALAGANAGVVGLLAAAFITPILRTAVHTPLDAVGAFAAFIAIHYANVPAWALVLVAALSGYFWER